MRLPCFPPQSFGCLPPGDCARGPASALVENEGVFSLHALEYADGCERTSVFDPVAEGASGCRRPWNGGISRVQRIPFRMAVESEIRRGIEAHRLPSALFIGQYVLYVNENKGRIVRLRCKGKIAKIHGMFRQYRERILEALKARGRTRADLARTTRIDFSYLDRLLKGKARFNEDHIEAISKALGVTPGREPGPIPVRITYSRQFADPRLPEKRGAEYLAVPVVDSKVAAGGPEIVTSEQVVDIAFIHSGAIRRRSVRGYICTYVKGDSMLPVLRDGAIVCIDTRARPEGKKVPKDSIWAVRKEGGAVVKHIQIQEGMILLVSENPVYEIESVADGDAIIGRVVGAWQNLA